MSARFDLAGKLALVTGGASGIGRACAGRYASAGASVIVTDVADDAGAQVAADIDATYRHLDVSDPDAWADLVAEIGADHGSLDLLHLNAGIRLGIGDLTDISVEDYQRIIGVNQHGVFYGMRAALPLVEAAGGGAMLVTASMASLAPLAVDPAYAMSKHAVAVLVRSVAGDFSQRGVSVNAICPAIVETGFLGESGRAQLEAAGLKVMDSSEVADGAMTILESGKTGCCFSQLPGGEPEEFGFSDVPGM